MKWVFLGIALMILGTRPAVSQAGENAKSGNGVTEAQMHTYVIERTVPGAGELTGEQLKAVSQTSVGVLDQMGPGIQWLHSYVTGDKIFCVYRASDKKLIEEHARMGHFPVDTIREVTSIINPFTAVEPAAPAPDPE